MKGLHYRNAYLFASVISCGRYQRERIVKVHEIRSPLFKKLRNLPVAPRRPGRPQSRDRLTNQPAAIQFLIASPIGDYSVPALCQQHRLRGYDSVLATCFSVRVMNLQNVHVPALLHKNIQ
jgi:hypothetical protein